MQLAFTDGRQKNLMRGGKLNLYVARNFGHPSFSIDHGYITDPDVAFVVEVVVTSHSRTGYLPCSATVHVSAGKSLKHDLYSR